MSTSDSQDAADDERVDGIIAAYLKAIEEGQSPDRQELLDRYPDLSRELAEFFSDNDRFQRAAAPLQAAADLAGDLTIDHSAPYQNGPGTKVRYFGDYEILVEIARGGMGVVYKAQQVSLNRVVALKMILAGQLASPAEVKRFHTEAEAAANLQHPNIVAIHEVGEFEGQHYFSMDFVEGRNLADLVRSGPLHPARAAAYVKTIAEAIHFAHQRGTLHRDLKPQNVLIDLDDRPRITDFGLAKRIEFDEGLTQTGEALGSPSYMPPEQAAGRHDQVGPQSDVYSLGAILYCLLTAGPPFQAATTLDTLRKAIEEQPIPPRKLNPEIPQDVETISLKCLEKQPERRYHSARELAEELGRFLNHEPIHARPISAARRTVFWASRHPWQIAGLASVLVVAALFLAYGLWVQNRFLVWKQTHADYTRTAGTLTEQLSNSDGISSLLYCGLIFTFLYYLKRAKSQVGIRQSGGSVAILTQRQPPSAALVTALTGIGVAAVLYALYVIALITDAYVWEGTFHVIQLFMPYAIIYFGSMAIWRVVSDFTKKAYGSTPGPLSPETRESIRQAVLAGEIPEAIKIYRSQFAYASLVEASEVVERIAAELEKTHPGVTAANRRLSSQLDTTRLALALIIGAAALCASLPMLPSDSRMPWTLEFIGGSFIIPLVTYFNRFKSHWPRVVAMSILPISIAISSWSIRAHYPQYELSYVGYVVGCLAGAVLVIFARKRRRVPYRQ